MKIILESKWSCKRTFYSFKETLKMSATDNGSVKSTIYGRCMPSRKGTRVAHFQLYKLFSFFSCFLYTHVHMHNINDASSSLYISNIFVFEFTSCAKIFIKNLLMQVTPISLSCIGFRRYQLFCKKH